MAAVASSGASAPAAASGVRGGGRPRLLERELFLSELRVLLSTDWDRPVGAVVVEGRLGTGKTALLGAACALAASSGWAVLRAGGDPARKSEPYGLLRQLLASAEGRPRPGPADEVVAELASRTRALAASRGVTFAVDDARFGDDASIEWLARLDCAAPRSGIRLVLAAGARAPGTRLAPVDWILSERSCRVMPLAPLSVDALAGLLEECLSVPAPPDAAFVRACHEATGGVPALFFALLRELVLRGVPPVAKSVGRVASLTSSSVARSVLARCTHVPQDARRLLEVVAVAAVPVELDLAAEVARLDGTRATAAVEALVDADVLASDRVLELQPPLVRRTVLAEIPTTRRRRLHAAVAEALQMRWAPLEQLAEHLAEREPSPDDQAARILEEAGNLALGHGASGRAVRYLTAALGAEPPGVGRGRILLARTRAEALDDPMVALGHLGAALDQGVAPLAAAKAGVGIVRALADQGQATAAGPLLCRLAGDLSAADDPVRLEVLVEAALLHRGGPVPAAVVADLEALAGARHRGQGDLERRSRALVALLAARSASTGAGVVVDGIRRAITGTDLVVPDAIACELWARALVALGRAGATAEALRHARDAREQARECHLVAAEAELTVAVGVLLRLEGDLRGAEAEARSAMALAEVRPRGRRADAAGCLVATLLDAGRLDEADGLLGGLVAEIADEPPPLEGHHLLEQRGRLRALQGQWSEALCDLLRAGQWADEHGIDSPAVTSWRGQAATAFSAVGRSEEAVRLAAEQVELARAQGAPATVAASLSTLAGVSPPGERLALLEEAATLAASSPSRLVHAVVLVQLGRALRQRGAPVRARTALREGADLAMERGCHPLLTVATAELRLAGARPRRLALRGAAALTSAERRVAELAAAGRTNAQIAEALYLSEKTVEGHLFRSYRKLGVRSRRQLGALLDGAPDAISAPTDHPVPAQSRGSDADKTRVFPHAGGA